jgi:hypothetical protein
MQDDKKTTAAKKTLHGAATALVVVTLGSTGVVSLSLSSDAVAQAAGAPISSQQRGQMVPDAGAAMLPNARAARQPLFVQRQDIAIVRDGVNFRNENLARELATDRAAVVALLQESFPGIRPQDVSARGGLITIRSRVVREEAQRIKLGDINLFCGNYKCTSTAAPSQR